MKRCKVLVPDYCKMYSQDEKSTTMSMTEYGMYTLERLVYQRQRDMITKLEYITLRNAIEDQLFMLNPYKPKPL